MDNSFILDDITISGVDHLDKDEIVYLVGLKKGQSISQIDLDNALFYLRQKKIFNKIIFKFSDSAPDHKILNLKLDTYWRFSGVRIRGFWRFGEDFINKYPQDYGLPFDLKLHNQFISKIKKRFIKLGYFNFKIKSHFIKNYQTKEIFVEFDVSKGPRYFIKDIEYKIDCDDLGTQDLFSNKIFQNFIKGHFKYKKVKSAISFLKKHLHSSGYFSPKIIVDIRKCQDNNSVYLVFKVKPGQKFNYKVLGNKSINSSFLMEHVVKKYYDMPIDVLINHIENLYKDQGYFDVQVDFKKLDDQVLLKIDEGDRYKILKVNFIGNKIIKSQKIRSIFNSLIATYFIKKDFDIAIQKLESFYSSNGFWNFTIIEKNFNKDGSVIINVNEGDQYKVNSASLENYKDFKFDFKKDSPCSPDLLKSMQSQIDFYMKSKNIFDYTLNPEFNPNKKGDLIWKVKLDNKGSDIGKIVILSNLKVPFKKFKKEFDDILIKDSDDINLDKVFYRIKRLDLFEYLNVKGLNKHDCYGLSPIVIQGFNTSKIELKTRLGFQKVNNFKLFDMRNRSTYKVGAGAVFRDFTGNGDKFTFDSDFTVFYRHLTAQYYLPFLFKLPIRTIFRLSVNKFYQPLFKGSDNSLYIISQQSGLMGLSYNHDDFTALKLGQGFEFRKLSNLSESARQALKVSSGFCKNRIPYFFEEPTIFYENVDNKINPIKGYSFFGSLKAIAAIGYKNFSYARLLLEGSTFQPMIDNKLILAARLRFGTMFSKTFEAILPSERFYLGGSNSLRSYPTDFAPPLVTVDCGDKIAEAPMGADFMFNSNIEFRFNLLKKFSVVLFQDLGLLSNPYHKSGLLTAWGFGLRYMTPLGPIRFDIGFRPKNNELDRNYSWFLTIGQAF